MTLANARRLAEMGTALLVRQQNLFDLAQVRELDSSSLTVIFAWMRAARARDRHVLIKNPPQNLLSLADLYGVTEFLPLA